MAALLNEGAVPNFERRRVERLTVSFPAKLLEIGHEPINGRVIDISTRGFAFEAAGDRVIGVGARVWLMLDGDDCFNARVVWNHKQFQGCEFVRAVPEDTIARLVATLNELQG